MLGQLFSKETQAIFYNWKEKPVQRMLDFDYVCGERPELPVRPFNSRVSPGISP